MNLKYGLEVAHYLWPEFKEIDGFVFFGWCAPESINMNSWQDRVDVEASLNHTHVLDLFDHEASLEKEPFWDTSHQDFQDACEFGKVWIQSITSKLSRDYPDKKFRIYYTQNDNPIVRFHQVYEGEPNWLDIESWADEHTTNEVVVMETNAL